MLSYVFVCPKDDAPSSDMKLIRVNKTYTVDEMLILKRVVIPEELAGERLQCPECKKIYGWHQLKGI